MSKAKALRTRLVRLLLRFQDKARFRSAFLLLVAITMIIYGAGLVTAGDPARQHWWPGAVGTLLRLPLAAWGAAWIAVGAYLLATFRTRRDRWQFTAAAGLNAVWACLAVQRWWQTGETGAWSPAVIYAGVTIAILLVSAWPDPPPGPPR